MLIVDVSCWLSFLKTSVLIYLIFKTYKYHTEVLQIENIKKFQFNLYISVMPSWLKI